MKPVKLVKVGKKLGSESGNQDLVLLLRGKRHGTT
jgi:hypothetical protein